jgi:hypothetical protein
VRPFCSLQQPPNQVRILAALVLGVFAALAWGSSALAADTIPFHITLLGEAEVPGAEQPRHCGDLWAEGNYAYIGSDRHNGGIAIFDISNPASPQFVTEYEGEEMEDVEVYNGIGYFGSDDNEATAATGTGVDIVNLSNPEAPTLITRVNAADGGHHKVHTLAVSNGFLYTTDNATPTIKVFNVSNPASPTFVTTVNLSFAGPGTFASHEVMVQNNRMYVASKNNSDAVNGWTHIYDVTNVRTTGPVLMKSFNTGGGTHTSMPSDDGSLLVISQERSNGEVRLYDISMIDQPNDPDPVPLYRPPITRSSTDIFGPAGLDAHSPHHSHMHGDVLFLSWYEAGMQVLNVSDPANPLWVGSYDTFPGGPPGGAQNFSGNWGTFHGLGLDKMLISDRNRGLLVVDATGVVPTGDFNADGSVDGADFLAWQRGLGVASNATLAQGDANRDRKVNGLDLPVWGAQFGQSQHHHPGAAVPEGSALAMSLLGALTVGSHRRRPRDR